MQDYKNNKNSLLISCISASCTLLADFITYPLDSLNTKIKSDSKTNQIKIIKNSYKKGVYGFYKGLSTLIPNSLPPGILFFLMYENINNYSLWFIDKYNKKKYKKIIPIISSSVSELSSLILYIPFDTVQTRIQSDIYKYNGLYDGLRQIIKNEGFLRLYLSCPLIMIEQLFLVTFQFSLYEIIRLDYLDNKKEYDRNLNYFESIKITLISGIITSLFYNPINNFTIKYQMFNTQENKIEIWKIMKEIYNSKGILGFNRGLIINTISLCINSIIYMPLYEIFRKKYGIPL